MRFSLKQLTQQALSEGLCVLPYDDRFHEWLSKSGQRLDFPVPVKSQHIIRDIRYSTAAIPRSTFVSAFAA